MLNGGPNRPQPHCCKYKFPHPQEIQRYLILTLPPIVFILNVGVLWSPGPFPGTIREQRLADSTHGAQAYTKTKQEKNQETCQIPHEWKVLDLQSGYE